MPWILAVILLALPLFAAPPFTIEQALSSPFPSDLVASPHGDAVAWVMDAKGVRNIWVARAPAFAAAPVTRFTADDGQDLDEICWMADGSALFFTRGGGTNARGEFPNPQSDPNGVRQEVWIAPVTGSAHKVGDGHAPMVAPDGSTVAWVLNGQIWSAGLKPDTKAAQLVHARGSAVGLAWSPDSTRLAFISNRVDHALIGVYDVGEKALHFVDASVDTDQSAVWSPDSRQIAFIRVPASRDARVWGPKRTAEPWSMRVADATTGRGREIWRAKEGMGSVFWPMVAANQLLWGANGRLVFPWERDGWLHLYSVTAAGGVDATLLTPGRFEIEHAAMDPDGRSVIFSSNQDDVDRRHLWRVAVNGGAPRRLTPGSGIEWAPAPLANGRMAMLHSDAKMPARAAILEDGGRMRELAPGSMPADFPAAAMVEPQPVMLTATDGLQIHGQLFLPANAGAGKHPAVIFFHGGSRRQMLLGWHEMFYYHQAYGFNQYLASVGYVVLSVNYRSGIGYGEEFREAPHYGATGASEYSDVVGAGAWLRGRPDVDASRIGLWGGSYGGYLTALGLARASDVFAAGVDLHGVHDWNLEIENAAAAYAPEKRVEVARVAFESSPLSSIATWRSPVLLIQGDDDRNVAFAQTVQMTEALRKQGVHVEQLIFPDEVHDFLVHAHWLAAYNATAEFLGRFLTK